MISRPLSALAGLMLAAAACGSESAPPKFARPPAVTQSGDGVRIEFAADRETDVAVSILDQTGRVVRHLVAGMLGRNAPAPLKAGTLEQSLEWDGKNDTGRSAEGGPFRVRVALGMTPVFDANLFDEPQRFSNLHGIAVGPHGEIYTRGSQGDGGWGPESDYRVFGRDGKYLRTIAPFPAGLAYDRVAGFGAFKDEEGDGYIPRVHQINHYCFYPSKMGEIRTTQMAVDGEGRVFFISGNNWMDYVCVVDRDGGVPAGWSFTGKGILDEKARIGRGGCLAMSSDDRRVYASGCPAAKGGRIFPAVLWTDAKERGPFQVLFGDLSKEGSGKDGLKAPRGICADGQGHLLVADSGNGRVAVLSEADGKLVGEFAVADVCDVKVERRTGEVYVLTFTKEGSVLVKFSNWKDPKEVCRLLLGGSRSAPFLALSPSTEQEKPVVWVGTNGHKRYTLLRIPDLGAKFGESVEVSAGDDYLMEDVFVDRTRNEVYLNVGPNYWRFKDGTDKAEMVPIGVGGSCGLTLRVCSKGNIYGHAYGDKFYRWDRSGKPLAFHQSGKNLIEIPSMMVYQLRGLHIDQLRDEIYLIQPNFKRKTPDCFGGVVRVYDLEGNLKREPIRALDMQSVGPAVDAAGNIYLAEPSRPGSPELPAFFKGKLPDIKAAGEDKYSVPAETFPYSWCYGAVVKFSPKGGSVPWGAVKDHKLYKPFDEDVPGATDPVMYGHGGQASMRVAKSQGVLWAHGEFYPVPNRAGCCCLASYFDVDYFGRSFYPDAARSRVGILDTQGNVICHFGAYGNRDAKGRDGYIPLAMGIAVAASDDYLYVADICNHRLVRVKVTYAAEEIVLAP